MEVIAKQKHQISTKGKDLHWIDGAFTADNLIDAYLKGHRDGCKMVVDLQSIFGLIKRSSAAISDFYNHSLKENGCYSVFMKIQDKTYFIAAIDKDVYFDENKRKISGAESLITIIDLIDKWLGKKIENEDTDFERLKNCVRIAFLKKVEIDSNVLL